MHVVRTAETVIPQSRVSNKVLAMPISFFVKRASAHAPPGQRFQAAARCSFCMVNNRTIHLGCECVPLQQ